MIFFGANDACLPGSDSGQYVPLEMYKDNLRSIIQHPTIQAQHPRLILVTPPPVNEYALEESDAARGIRCRRRTAEHTKLYADACREIVCGPDLLVLDMWSWIMSRAGYKPSRDQILPGSKKTQRNAFLDQVLSDGKVFSSPPLCSAVAQVQMILGLHFNPLGYKILFEATMVNIARRWPDQAPEKLGLVYPSWQVAPKFEP